MLDNRKVGRKKSHFRNEKMEHHSIMVEAKSSCRTRVETRCGVMRKKATDLSHVKTQLLFSPFLKLYTQQRINF